MGPCVRAFVVCVPAGDMALCLLLSLLHRVLLFLSLPVVVVVVVVVIRVRGCVGWRRRALVAGSQLLANFIWRWLAP